MKIITHSGRFHADDVFAVATLLSIYPSTEVIRTRDSEVIKKGDIVVDVGGVYDPSIGRFDHHQRGGAGVRENGIPYASFGLVWKEYGEKIVGGKEAAKILEETVVLPIDAIDNGVEISKPMYDKVWHYDIGAVVNSFLPDSDDTGPDEAFKEVVKFASGVLQREIASAKTEVADEAELTKLARRNGGDAILLLPRFLRGKDALIDFPGILYTVFPGRGAWGDDYWYVKAVRRSHVGFENKKPLPADWGGKEGAELVKVSGVSDAVFCHRGRFLCAAKSKEGALVLAKKAVEA